MKVIDSINQDLGTTIIMATHDKAIVDKMKKRVVAIDNGVIVHDQEKGKYYENIKSSN